MYFSHMPSLLTKNGVPPQLIGAFSVGQQKAMTDYAQDKPGERYEEKYKKRGFFGEKFIDASYPEPLLPFINATLDLVSRFQEWGAEVIHGINYIQFSAKDLSKGETTVTRDFNLHADVLDAAGKLKHENRIYLRTLCVSRDPATFIDLTARSDMKEILDQHRISGSRVYNSELLLEADNKAAPIITPDCWDIIVFDGDTPHQPKGASLPNRRIFMSGRVELELPENWKSRVQINDVPHREP